MTPARIAAGLLAAGLLVGGAAPAQDKYPSKVVPDRASWIVDRGW